MAVAVAALAFALGWPSGVLAGVFAFPARRALLALLAVRCSCPASLRRSASPVFGWMASAARCWPLPPRGCRLSRSSPWPRCAASRGAEADAARVAGSEWQFARLAARSVWPTALLTAVLAGALTLSDAGPGQIFGVRGAAGEILVSFSAQYDFGHAARQCLALALVAALVALPVVLFLAPRLDAALLARDTLAMQPVKSPTAAWLAPLLLSALVAACFGVPLLGMVMALTRRFAAAQAWQEVSRTLPGTFGFAIGAAAVALVLGAGLMLSAGRSRARQVAVLALALLIVALPPALTALGLLHLATHAPASADWLLRSGLTPGLALGARVFPVVLFLGLRRWGTMPPSWAAAAAAAVACRSSWCNSAKSRPAVAHARRCARGRRRRTARHGGSRHRASAPIHPASTRCRSPFSP